MWAVKLVGALFLIFSCGFIGLKMANRLKIRAKTLRSFLICLDSITVYIRLSDFHIEEILDKCLPDGMTYDGKGLIAKDSLCLREEDRQLINEFLFDLGMADIDCLLNKCKSYRELFLTAISDADRDVSERYRLFAVSGFLLGLTLSFLWW